MPTEELVLRSMAAAETHWTRSGITSQLMLELFLVLKSRTAARRDVSPTDEKRSGIPVFLSAKLKENPLALLQVGWRHRMPLGNAVRLPW
jgi:hypothetical protein